MSYLVALAPKTAHETLGAEHEPEPPQGSLVPAPQTESSSWLPQSTVAKVGLGVGVAALAWVGYKAWSKSRLSDTDRLIGALEAEGYDAYVLSPGKSMSYEVVERPGSRSQGWTDDEDWDLDDWE